MRGGGGAGDGGGLSQPISVPPMFCQILVGRGGGRGTELSPASITPITGSTAAPTAAIFARANEKLPSAVNGARHSAPTFHPCGKPSGAGNGKRIIKLKPATVEFAASQQKPQRPCTSTEEREGERGGEEERSKETGRERGR